MYLCCSTQLKLYKKLSPCWWMTKLNVIREVYYRCNLLGPIFDSLDCTRILQESINSNLIISVSQVCISPVWMECCNMLCLCNVSVSHIRNDMIIWSIRYENTRNTQECMYSSLCLHPRIFLYKFQFVNAIPHRESHDSRPLVFHVPHPLRACR